MFENGKCYCAIRLTTHTHTHTHTSPQWNVWKHCGTLRVFAGCMAQRSKGERKIGGGEWLQQERRREGGRFPFCNTLQEHTGKTERGKKIRGGKRERETETPPQPLGSSVCWLLVVFYFGGGRREKSYFVLFEFALTWGEDRAPDVDWLSVNLCGSKSVANKTERRRRRKKEKGDREDMLRGFLRLEVALGCWRCAPTADVCRRETAKRQQVESGR